MFSSIVVAGIVAFLMSVAEQRFSGEKVVKVNLRPRSYDDELFNVRAANLNIEGIGRAVVFGSIVGIINFTAPKLTGVLGWIAVAEFIVMTLLYAYLMYRWHDVGQGIVGAICFITIAILMRWTMVAVAYMTTEFFGVARHGRIENFLLVMPTILLVAAIAFCVIESLYLQGAKTAKLAKTSKEYRELDARSAVYR